MGWIFHAPGSLTVMNQVPQKMRSIKSKCQQKWEAQQTEWCWCQKICLLHEALTHLSPNSLNMVKPFWNCWLVSEKLWISSYLSGKNILVRILPECKQSKTKQSPASCQLSSTLHFWKTYLLRDKKILLPKMQSMMMMLLPYEILKEICSSIHFVKYSTKI